MPTPVLIHGVENFVGRRLLAALRHSDWAQPVPLAAGDLAALRGPEATSALIVHAVVGDATTIRRRSAALYATLAAIGHTGRVVHFGSMTVYGSATGHVAEDSPLRADLGPYSQAQLYAEGLARQHGNTVVLRSGAEYGPECPVWSGRIARLLRAGRLGDLGAAGDGHCNLTYIDDLCTVAGTALCREGIAGEAFNVASSEPITWNDYFIAFAQALGAVPVRRITPRRLRLETKLLAIPLKLAEVLLRGRVPTPPPLPPALLRLCGQDLRLDVGKAERRLDASWTPLAAGIAAASQTYRRS